MKKEPHINHVKLKILGKAPPLPKLKGPCKCTCIGPSRKHVSHQVAQNSQQEPHVKRQTQDRGPVFRLKCVSSKYYTATGTCFKAKLCSKQPTFALELQHACNMIYQGKSTFRIHQATTYLLRSQQVEHSGSTLHPMIFLHFQPHYWLRHCLSL